MRGCRGTGKRKPAMVAGLKVTQRAGQSECHAQFDGAAHLGIAHQRGDIQPGAEG